MNVLFRIGHLEEKQLRDDQVGNHVIHRRAQENDPIHQQARVDVIPPFATASLLNYHWHQKVLHKNLFSTEAI